MWRSEGREWGITGRAGGEGWGEGRTVRHGPCLHQVTPHILASRLELERCLEIRNGGRVLVLQRMPRAASKQRPELEALPLGLRHR